MNLNQINKKIEKSILLKITSYISIFLCVVIGMFSFFNLYLMNSLKNDIEDNSVMSGKCNYFLFSKNLEAVVSEKNVELNKRDVYVFPEIQNITCLGKVGYLENIDSSYSGTVYTNTKFINYLIISTNSFLLAFVLFTKKLSGSKYCLLFIIFNGGIVLNFYHSLNVISINFITIPMLIRILDWLDILNE